MICAALRVGKFPSCVPNDHRFYQIFVVIKGVPNFRDHDYVAMQYGMLEFTSLHPVNKFFLCGR